MKVLYITYTGLSDNLGASQILPYIKSLAARGVEFKVVSFESSGQFAERRSRLRLACEGLPIECFPVNRGEGHGRLALAAALFKAVKLSVNLARTWRPDLIHCRNALAAECAMVASSASGIPYLFDMRGFWGDARKETGQWNQSTLRGRLIYRFWKSRERKYLVRSSLTNCLTNKARDWIVSHGYKGDDEVLVTPCCVNFSGTTPRAEKGARPFTCVYVGSMGGVYDDSRLFRVFRAAKEAFPGARLRILTSRTPSEIVDFAGRLGFRLDEQELEVMRVPHHEVFRWIRSADVGISFCKPGFFATGVSSTKIGEYLSQGLPVISNEGLGDVSEILAETEGGLVLPDHISVEAEKEMVRAFLADARAMDRERIRASSRRLLDVSVATSNYQRAYEAISNRSNHDG